MRWSARSTRVDKAQPVTNVTTLEQLLKDKQFATPRFNLVLLSVFATVGLALAVVGVYGVMSSAVAQERQEIGVRMALGADAGTISRMVLARGSRLLLAGTAIGLLGSFAVGRWLAGAVWRVAGSIRCLRRGGGAAARGWPAGVLLAGPPRRAHRPAHCAEAGVTRVLTTPAAHDRLRQMARQSVQTQALSQTVPAQRA